jgi:transcription antitermination factor NusG
MRWNVIRHTPGVASYLANSAGVPYLLPSAIIETVRDLVAKDPKPEAKAKRPEFRKDELLAVISGIYTQYRARFDGWEGEQCRVFIHMLGRDTKHRIDPKHLERL